MLNHEEFKSKKAALRLKEIYERNDERWKVGKNMRRRRGIT
jgi:hypothetical protein